jgi:hypothetical protein
VFCPLKHSRSTWFQKSPWTPALAAPPVGLRRISSCSQGSHGTSANPHEGSSRLLERVAFVILVANCNTSRFLCAHLESQHTWCAHGCRAGVHAEYSGRHQGPADCDAGAGSMPMPLGVFLPAVNATVLLLLLLLRVKSMWACS